MRTAQAHAPTYTPAPSINWVRPLALIGALAFSALVWAGVGWAIAQLF